MNDSSPDKYPLSLRLLHWLMAALIIALLAIGLIMTGLPKGDPTRASLYSLHKSLGITVLALVAVRLIIRLSASLAPLPAAIPRWERSLAKFGHYILYAFMFALPLSGYVLTNSYGLNVKWFGMALPKIVGVDRERGAFSGDLHSYMAYTLIGLLAGHVGAVIWHYARQRVNLLRRMV